MGKDLNRFIFSYLLNPAIHFGVKYKLYILNRFNGLKI